MNALASIRAEPTATALIFDVDGTLAPIVPNREDARVPDATRSELERLHSRYALVACVSGRQSDDAERVVGVPSLTYVGEHGLELDEEATAWSNRITAFAARASWPAEQKKHSVAFHFRNAPDERAARTELEQIERQAQEEGLRTRWGRMILEVLPPIDASKRTAVEHLLENAGLQRALYAGDDTTDLDAFAALDGLELGVRVAVMSDEGPTELRDRADLVVGSPAELAALLDEL